MISSWVVRRPWRSSRSASCPISCLAHFAASEHLFVGCGIRYPSPRCGAAGSVGPHLALVLELVQDEPDGLVTDAWNGRPDVCEAECGWCVAQDVLADALLLGSRGLSCCRAIGEDGVGVGGHVGEVAEAGDWIGRAA